MKKNIINIKNILLAATVLVGLSFSSCIPDDMNKNQMNPTTTDIGPLFNGVVSSLVANSNEQFYLWNELFYPESELGALTSEAWGNTNIGIDAVWNNYYLALANIHDIDRRLDEMCESSQDNEIDDKVRAQLIVVEAFKTFKVTDMFGDIPYSEAGYIWYNTVENRKPKYDSQESIYKTLLEELVWARNVLSNGKAKTSLGNTFGDEGWAFREHKNLRMGETVFAQMSKTNGTPDNTIFDPRVYIFFDTNNKTAEYPEGAWRAYPQMRNASTPTEGGTPYSSTRDKNYAFKGPACLYSPFNFYLVRDHVFVPQMMISPAEVSFIKAELTARGITPGGLGMATEEHLRKGIEYSFNFWLQLPIYGTDATYKYIYKDLQTILDGGDLYSISSAYASNIMNEMIYFNTEFTYSEEDYLEVIYQQRWLDLFRQANEAWNLARRTKGAKVSTPTTIEHKKLVTNRLPYPQSEVTYNSENYQEQVKKMGGDTREIKVWWMQD